MRKMICSATTALLLAAAAGASAAPQADEAERTRAELAARGMTLDDLFQQIFAQAIPPLKAQLPQRMNDEMELYDVSGRGTEMTYSVRLLLGNADSFDKAKAREFARSTLVPSVCAKPDMLQIMKIGGTYRYDYVGLDNKPVTSVVVAAKDCTKG